MNRISCKRFIIVSFLAEIIFLMASGFWVYDLYQRPFSDDSAVIESYQTIRSANQILISLNQAGLDVNYFLLTRNKEAIKKLPEIIITAQVNMATLYQLISDDNIEIQIFNKLKPLVDEKIKFLKTIIPYYLSNDKLSPPKIVINLSRLRLLNQITQYLIEIKKIEMGQLEQASFAYQYDINTVNRIFILLGILNILLMLFIYIVARRFLDGEN